MRANNSWICPFCADGDGTPKEFRSLDDYSQHMQAHEKGEETKVFDPPVEIPQAPVMQEKKPEVKKIELTYKYTGQCSCGAPIDTIELDVGTKAKEHICVAWCPVCKKEQTQRAVTKL